VLVTGDAYVDHPSFGMAVIGRVLEAQGFRVGIIAQPDWQSAEPFMALGRPNLFFGVAAGNMDSMINRYTADRKPRSDDAYTPGGEGGKRPDRATIVYTSAARGLWRRADRDRRHRGQPAPHRPLRLLAGQGAPQPSWWMRRPTCCCTAMPSGPWSRSRTAWPPRAGASLTDIRGTAFLRKPGDPTAAGWFELDSTEVDLPGRMDEHINPYQTCREVAQAQGAACVKEVQPKAPRHRHRPRAAPSSPCASCRAPRVCATPARCTCRRASAA
jgi:hypothetical protein